MVTAFRTSPARRPLPVARRALLALAAGAGVALTPLPAWANSTDPVPGASAPAAPAAAATPAAQMAVDTALAQLGDPYEWAGAGPDTFDCSGLTQYAYGAAGMHLPHSSRLQSATGTPVAYADLQPGDLVFFYSPVSHVGMYIGNGQIVNALNPGAGIRISALNSMPYAGAVRPG
jgi:cell wall-associated NlpC family hydrolase